MKYMGSKARLAKYILPIILKDRRPDQWYVEPFVGGANLIDKVTGPRLGADINPYLAAYLDAASKGWIPPETFTEDEYRRIKNNKTSYPDYLVGYVGFALSYGGKFFGGWCRDSAGKRNHVKEAHAHALKQHPLLAEVVFQHRAYDDLRIPENSLIYCDPPYRKTTKYGAGIDYDHFYQWCRSRAGEGHTVFLSEYTAPDDFITVFEKEQTSSLTKATGSKKGIEKLFKLFPRTT